LQDQFVELLTVGDPLADTHALDSLARSPGPGGLAEHERFGLQCLRDRGTATLSQHVQREQ
jgi:hypothetical protein